MKKSIFLAALVLISAGCFAQKANVSKARNLSDSETPDFAGARAAINLALENDVFEGVAVLVACFVRGDHGVIHHAVHLTRSGGSSRCRN